MAQWIRVVATCERQVALDELIDVRVEVIERSRSTFEARAYRRELYLMRPNEKRRVLASEVVWVEWMELIDSTRSIFRARSVEAAVERAQALVDEGLWSLSTGRGRRLSPPAVARPARAKRSAKRSP